MNWKVAKRILSTLSNHLGVNIMDANYTKFDSDNYNH